MNKFLLKKIIHVFLRTCFFFTLLGIIVVEWAFVFASTPAGKNAVRHILAYAITANTGAGADIGKISGNIIGSLVIDDLCIYGPDGKSPALSAGRIRASYDILALFFRKVSIHSLELDRVFACLDIDENKGVAIPGMTFSGRDAGRRQGQWPVFMIHIAGLVVTDSRILITDRSGPQPVVRKISHISGRAEVRVGKKVFVSISSLGFTPDEPYPKVSDLSGRIVLDPEKNRIAVSSVRIAGLGSSVAVNGSLVLGQKEAGFNLKADVASLSCAQIGKAFGFSGGGGYLSGTISVSGTQNRFSFDVGLKSRAARVFLAGRIRHDGKAWILPNVSGRVDHLNPSACPFFPARKLPANLNLLVSGSGMIPASLEFMDSEFSGDIEILDSMAGGIEHVTGKLSAVYADHRLNVGSFELASPGGKFTGSGGVDLQTRDCAAAFSANVSDLAPFSGLIDAGNAVNSLSGHASVSGTISGTIDRPMVTAALEGSGLRLNSSAVQTMRAACNWKGGSSLGTISCRARASGISAGALRFSSLSFESSATADTIRVSGTATAFDTRIHATANLKDRRSGKKTLTITRLALDAKGQAPIVNTGPFVAIIDGRRIEVYPVELVSGKAKLNFSGRMDFSPGGEILLNADCRDFSLERIAPFFEGIKGISGRADAKIRVANTLEDPAIDADILISDPLIMGIGFSDAHLSLDGKKGEYKVVLDAKQDGKKTAALSGSIFLPVCLYPFLVRTESERMDLRLRVSDFSFAGIDLPFLDDVLVQGKLFADARITGGFTAPKAAGDIRFSNGSLVVKSLGLSYETCTGEIRFSQNRVRVVGVNIKGDREGSLSASGTLSFSGRTLGEIDLSLSGKNFYVPFHKAVFLRTEPELTLTGTAGSPVLKGKIRVAKGKIDLLRLFSQRPAEIEMVNVPENGADVLELPEKAKQPGFMEPFSADIMVDVKRDLWVKGKEENIEIRGRVNVKKSPGHPFVVLGRANAVRGTYMFRNRLFKISDGNLIFLGGEEIDPVLNITGRTRIPPVDILAHLTGTFSRLNLSLDSEPAMDQVDIVSYLMFGRASTGLSSGESFRAEDAALSMTGQLAADQLKDILGKSFRLDVVQVNAGSGDIRQGSISMGKYVAPRVFVTYSQGFSQEAGRSVEIDYEVNRHFSIEAQAGEETTSALDLIWRHDF